MSDSYFNEENDYTEENTCDNKVFCSTILPSFQFEPKQKKACGNESHETETKHIHASAANILHIRVENLDWSAREVSHYPAFMGIFRTISYTC